MRTEPSSPGGLCAALPRHAFCSMLPTPLEPLPRLSAQTGGPAIYIKREDLTGLALGGNKIRNLEFIFGELLEQGYDAVITTAGVQSNMCRATAAAAARLGMPCMLLLRGNGEEAPQGNLLLDGLLGAEVRFIPTQDPYDERVPGWLEEARLELEGRGHKPYVLHLTGSSATVAACAYVSGAEELAAQFQAMEHTPQHLFLTCGSGITMAGLVLGFKHLGLPIHVTGVSSSARRGFLAERVMLYARQAAERLGLETRIEAGDFSILDQYVGPGYGKPQPETLETIRQVARLEGILLDPVYTGKCMTALLDQVRKGSPKAGESVVFLHSGGVPNLFQQAPALSAGG